jgi:hypothetical protein
VNEIMSGPAPGEPEWVEVINTLGDTTRLGGWQLSDASAGPWRPLAPGEAELPPGGLAVLTRDSAALREARGWIPAPVVQVAGFPSLNNDGDLVLLSDPRGRVVDSVPYRPSWHTPLIGAAAGRSLERVHPALPSSDPRSWGTSVAPGGATPGLPNSLLARALPRASALSCAPNPFSPDGDGRDDLLMIRFALPSPSGIFSLVLYDVRGRKVRCLADHEPCGPERMVAWDGRDDAGGRAPVGMYIILLEAAPADGSPVLEARAVAVLALPL